MKKEKKYAEVGDVITVEFLENKKGGKPICRVDGKVCFVTRKYRGFLEPRSLWTVSIEELREKSGVIYPLERIKTAHENIKDIEMISKVVFSKPVKERKKKPHIKYSNL
jgi:hypothetical protein